MKVLIVFGTRPEAIKMAPLVKYLKSQTQYFDVKVCVTAQHREMLDQVLDLFNIIPDYDLDIMRPGQDLYSVTARVVEGMKSVLQDCNPDWVLVHGDTTTSFAAALAAFYAGSKIGHVEAGLRTNDLQAPFPEEGNRQLTSRLANAHFAPTVMSKNNLLLENIPEERIFITGNTVIDALLSVRDTLLKSGAYSEILRCIHPELLSKRPVILITAHRRENFGEPIKAIAESIRESSIARPDILFVYPVHPNPNIIKPVYDVLSGLENVVLIDPLNYEELVCLMDRSNLILTDSGGIQEEAPTFGKHVLVLREVTERQEAVTAGVVELVGSNKELIINRIVNFKYDYCSEKKNPFGDGNASQYIANFLISAS